MISADTKDALARDVPDADHCREALRTGLIVYSRASDGKAFVTHRNAIARLFWSLLDDRKAHPIETRTPTRLGRLPTFAISLPDVTAQPQPTRKCDRLMEIRGAFLACGSLAAGTRGYHLEFVLPGTAQARRLRTVLARIGLPAKSTTRARYVVLYYKDFETIVELLTRIGAFPAVLHLQDVRALRETKNRVHRLVNTEAANLERTAKAAAASRRTIEYLADAYGLSQLSPRLREIAELRLAYPDESLAELGRRCNPAVGKPTVGSRLAALGRLAERLRDGQGRPLAVR